MKNVTLIPIFALALIGFAISGFPAAAVLAGPGPSGGQTLTMMGGGGHMMDGQGYGGPAGGMRGGRGYGWNGFSGENDNRGYPNSYRENDRRALRNELRMERRELSDMIRSKNADPDQVDRKLDQIERLERRLDDMR